MQSVIGTWQGWDLTGTTTRQYLAGCPCVVASEALLPPLHDPGQLAWTVVSVWMEMAWIFFLNEHVKTVHL
jgi:hypothetical protein